MIPRLTVVAPAVLLALGLIGCGESRTGFQASQGTGKGPVTSSAVVVGGLRTLKETPFERSWDLDLGHPVLIAWIAPDVENLVFFQLDETFEIVAVDVMSGHTRWVSKPLPEALRLAPYAARNKLPTERPDVFRLDERLYVVSQDTLFCLDCATGHLIWRFDLPFSPSTGPVAVGLDETLRVYLGDWSGRLQAVSFHPKREFAYQAWQWNINASATAQGLAKDEVLYFGDHGGTLSAFKSDRQQAWSNHLGGAIYGAPAVRDRTLFAGTTENTLYALNRLTGETLGQVNLNGPLTKAPMVFRGDPERIYAWVGGPEQTAGLYAFTAQSDTVAYTDTARHPLEVVRLGQRWSVPGLNTLVSSTPAYLYATDGSPVISAVNRDSGVVDWRWDVNAERLAEQQAAGVRRPAKVAQLLAYQDPTDLNRSVFAIDEKGGVVSYRFFGFVPGDHLPVASGDVTPVVKAKGGKAKEGEAPAEIPAKPGKESKP